MRNAAFALALIMLVNSSAALAAPTRGGGGGGGGDVPPAEAAHPAPLPNLARSPSAPANRGPLRARRSRT